MGCNTSKATTDLEEKNEFCTREPITNRTKSVKTNDISKAVKKRVNIAIRVIPVPKTNLTDLKILEQQIKFYRKERKIRLEKRRMKKLDRAKSSARRAKENGAPSSRSSNAHRNR